MVKPRKPGRSVTLIWTPDADAAFLAAKKALSDTAMLSSPDVETSIARDASDTGTGAILQQLVGGAWKPIAFFSQKLNTAETKYSAYD